MTISITRAQLTEAFPKLPRLVAELQKLVDFVNTLSDQGQATSDTLAGVVDDLGAGNKFQPSSDILTAIAALPNRVGAVEILNDGSAAIRPIDSQDPVSLLSRGASYTILVGILGIGTTAQRPTGLPANAVGVYFDTTLAAAGKPIFWNGASWVDATGTAA